MRAATFAIIGAGWRAEFFLRIAAALPDRFRVTGVMTRDAARSQRVRDGWSVPVRSSLDELLADRPSFVVLSVPRNAAPGLMRELAARGVPVLAETPPAEDLDTLLGLADLAASGARIQVAEQYQFQPEHAARLAVARSGVLGTVTQAQVSIAHDYHGINLMRQYLGVGFSDVAIRARRFTSPIVEGSGREGPPAGERIVNSEQVLATFDFGDRLGVYDFTADQYFSWIRSARLLLRGERGELNGLTVRHLLDATTPVAYDLVRRDTGLGGNLEGHHHAGITAGDAWVYRNPFAPARLADDEIAVATCLARMAEYIDGGQGFCSLAEASWDLELTLRMAESLASGEEVRVSGALWAGADR
jgi:predicted dehydrogenase